MKKQADKSSACFFYLDFLLKKVMLQTLLWEKKKVRLKWIIKWLSLLKGLWMKLEIKKILTEKTTMTLIMKNKLLMKLGFSKRSRVQVSRWAFLKSEWEAFFSLKVWYSLNLCSEMWLHVMAWVRCSESTSRYWNP